MAINLGKSSGVLSSNPTPLPPSAPVNYPADPVEALRSQIITKVFDGYCDEVTMNGLIQYGVSFCGLEQKKAEIVLGMELESRGISNEKVLLIELEALLHRFTNSDKKLDEKEKNDAIQFICKARTGYAKGLNFDVASHYITEFCRRNRVKIKMGLFKWEIP